MYQNSFCSYASPSSSRKTFHSTRKTSRRQLFLLCVDKSCERERRKNDVIDIIWFLLWSPSSELWALFVRIKLHSNFSSLSLFSVFVFKKIIRKGRLIGVVFWGSFAVFFFSFSPYLRKCYCKHIRRRREKFACKNPTLYRVEKSRRNSVHQKRMFKRKYKDEVDVFVARLCRSHWSRHNIQDNWILTSILGGPMKLLLRKKNIYVFSFGVA